MKDATTWVAVSVGMSSAGFACRTGPCILTPQGGTSSAIDLMRVQPRLRGTRVQMVRIKMGGSSGLGELTHSLLHSLFSVSPFQITYVILHNAMQCHSILIFCPFYSPHNHLFLHYDTCTMSMPSISLSYVHGSNPDRHLRHDASIPL